LTKIIQKIRNEITDLAMQRLVGLETKEKNKRIKERTERFEEKHPNLIEK
jgi:hypothetical protein